MSKHSPGPWVIAKSGISVDVGASRLRFERGNRDEEQRANCLLIAAAPELLEAANAAWALIMALPDPDPVWVKTRDRLVAAIAKAEGRSG